MHPVAVGSLFLSDRHPFEKYEIQDRPSAVNVTLFGFRNFAYGLFIDSMLVVYDRAVHDLLANDFD